MCRGDDHWMNGCPVARHVLVVWLKKRHFTCNECVDDRVQGIVQASSYAFTNLPICVVRWIRKWCQSIPTNLPFMSNSDQFKHSQCWRSTTPKTQYFLIWTSDWSLHQQSTSDWSWHQQTTDLESKQSKTTSNSIVLRWCKIRRRQSHLGCQIFFAIHVIW